MEGEEGDEKEEKGEGEKEETVGRCVMDGKFSLLGHFTAVLDIHPSAKVR
mgnify:CR=1 FL=1